MTQWLEFDGVNDHIVLPDLGLCEDKTFTYEVWYRTPMIPSSAIGYLVAERSSSSGTPYACLIVQPTTGVVSLIMKNDAGTGVTCSTAAGAVDFSTSGNIYHLVATCAADLMKVYVNSTNSGTTTPSPPTGALSTDLSTAGAQRLSGYLGGSGFIKGGLAAVRLYSTTLDDTQVLANYNAGPDATGSPSGGTKIEISGSLKPVLAANILVDGVWRPVFGAYERIGGAWKPIL